MFEESFDDALSNDVFPVLFLHSFHREITGLQKRSRTVVIRYHFRNNDGQLIFIPNNDASVKFMLKYKTFYKMCFSQVSIKKTTLCLADKFKDRLKYYLYRAVHGGLII